MYFFKIKSLARLALGVFFCAAALPASASQNYFFGEGAGWVDAKPALGDGLAVGGGRISGYAWSEAVGWIYFGPAGTVPAAASQTPGDFGVRLEGAGPDFDLSGFAWGEQTGWIRFDHGDSAATARYLGSTDPARFSGYAWSESLGWIKLGDLTAQAEFGFAPALATTSTTTVTSDAWTDAAGTTSTTKSVAVGGAAVPAGYSLAVDGRILAEEVVIEMSESWPDFVFDENYSLRPLAELEAFTRAERHLPGVPSANDVGDTAPIGATVRALLENLETFFLYLFDHEKEISDLEARVAALEKLTQK